MRRGQLLKVLSFPHFHSKGRPIVLLVVVYPRFGRIREEVGNDEEQHRRTLSRGPYYRGLQCVRRDATLMLFALNKPPFEMFSLVNIPTWEVCDNVAALVRRSSALTAASPPTQVNET